MHGLRDRDTPTPWISSFTYLLPIYGFISVGSLEEPKQSLVEPATAKRDTHTAIQVTYQEITA